jgi:hypothetical protein
MPAAVVYQIIDVEDMFTHGIYTDLEGAKTAARKLKKDRGFEDVQINVIPLNRIGRYSEEINGIWSVEGGDESPVEDI